MKIHLNQLANYLEQESSLAFTEALKILKKHGLMDEFLLNVDFNLGFDLKNVFDKSSQIKIAWHYEDDNENTIEI